MKKTCHWAAVSLAFIAVLNAEFVYGQDKKEDEKLPIDFGAYVDTYYAYDFNNPANRDRQYTTQPARHNEFNVNLAYIDAKLNAEKFRGRVALQVGTSVQSNYSAEPAVGTISGSSLSRHIQEATAGYRITDKLWVDGGIYLSHIGLESWISRDNWTYTRSLMAEYSPYYETGAKLSYRFNEQWSAQFHVLNGWQNISENNGNKAIGTQVAFAPSQSISFTYNTFLGNEVGDRKRFFNDLIAKFVLSEKLQLALSYDIGMQRNATYDGYSAWQAAAIVSRYQLAQKLALAARVEGYSDPDQVIVQTGSSSSFKTLSASLGADVALHKRITWRNEVRYFWSKENVWVTKSGNSSRDGFVVTSLSLSI